MTSQPHTHTRWFDSSHKGRRPFTAPAWLANSHAQTFAGMLPLWAPPRSFRPSRAEGLRFPLPKGGALHAHAWWHTQAGSNRVHGLATSYVRRTAAVVIHGGGG